jgi:apolipoprotein N-acyltransferase
VWYLIGLSALMFNLAFFFSDYCGFLILFFLVPLAYCTIFTQHAWRDGFMWGLCVFGLHFSWLFLVIIRHSAAHWVMAVLIYAVIVVLFSLSSGAWLWISAKFFIGWRKVIWFLMTSWVYWFIALDWIVCPFGLPGYPFLNPLIPLAAYRQFLRIISLCMVMFTNRQVPGNELIPHIHYCPPVVNRVVNATAVWKKSAYGVGQKIYAQLQNLHKSLPGTTRLLVTPESMFCFPLNYYPSIITQWGSVLADTDHLLMGSVIEQQGRFFQAVFWLHKGLIIKFYVKKLLTPFVEKMPDSWKSIQPLKSPFIGNLAEFCDDAQGVGAEFFDIGSMRVVPRICLEFFFCKPHDFDTVRTTDRSVWVFLFANDSWFDCFFRRILFLSARLKANYINLPVLYSGHFGYYAIKPGMI